MVNFIEKRKQTVGFISESSSNEEHDVIQGAAPCRVCVEVEKRCRHLRSPCVVSAREQIGFNAGIAVM